MISKSEKKKIQKVIGFRYVADVQNHLRKVGALNKDGEEHSASMITNVMNGTPHEVIEEAIIEVYTQKKKELQAKANKRKNILKAK